MSNIYNISILSVLQRSTAQILITYKQKTTHFISYWKALAKEKILLKTLNSTTISSDHMSQTLEKHPFSHQQFINILIWLSRVPKYLRMSLQD